MQDDYLAHHGVKGMHWGVHNAETAARYRKSSSGGRKLKKRNIAIAAAAIAGATAMGAVNPATYAMGAAAVGKAVGFAAPLVARKAVYSIGNYVGTKAINKAAKTAMPKAKKASTRKILRELSEETVTEVAVKHGKKALRNLLYE